MTEDLIREGRKHDAAMAPPPWQSHVWYNTDEGGHAAVGPHHKSCDDLHCDHAPGSCSDSQRADVDATGIAWLRNNIGALLDRMEAAEVVASAGEGHRRAAEHYQNQVAVVGRMHNELLDRVSKQRDDANRDIADVISKLESTESECERMRSECNDSADRDAELYQLRAVVAAMRRGGAP